MIPNIIKAAGTVPLRPLITYARVSVSEWRHQGRAKKLEQLIDTQ